jgi:hypothetical protein
MFKKIHGDYLVAVKSYDADTDEYTYLDFYEYKRGTLVQVKGAVLPVKANQEFKYKRTNRPHPQFDGHKLG